MKDADCVSFLQWCLPRLGYRWPGFRKVRGQVCKRVARRVKELGLTGVAEYRTFLESHVDEWDRLDACCRITISRFYRDRTTFETLRNRLLPDLARRCVTAGRLSVDCWSAGCCSGEEPHTLQILWQLSVLPASGLDIPLRIVATDANPHVLERARDAVYPISTLKDLPDDLRSAAFERTNGDRRLLPDFRDNIEWVDQDIRRESPGGPFDIVFCRNLAFTYFAEPLQREVVTRLHATSREGGFLVIGSHERLPVEPEALFREIAPCVYKRLPHGSTAPLHVFPPARE